MREREPDCDVIIVGAGHNGLVTAAYLARAGLSVRVIERRGIVGGAAVTEEFHPGFRNSTCSYTVSLLNQKVMDDLDLKRHGLRIIFRPVSNFFPYPDGRSITFFPEIHRTQSSIEAISARDAKALPDYFATLDRIVKAFRVVASQTPPNVGSGWSELLVALQAVRPLAGLDLETQRDLIDIMTLSAADFLARWFESDEVRGAFAFDGTVGSLVSPYHPGTAVVLLHHAFGEIDGRSGAWGHAVGGMGAISNAIAAAAREAGAQIEVGTGVAEVIVEDGRATGIRTQAGRVMRAPVIAANVNPKLLFLDLLTPGSVPDELTDRFRNYRCASGSFRMNVALNALPRFTSARGHSADVTTSGIIIAPGLAYMDDAWRDAMRDGWSRRPIVEMLIPSTVDETLAPGGHHVASLFCQHFNPDLPDGTIWDAAHREKAADLIIDTVNDYAPNFRDSVIARKILSPLDLEREFGLVGGDIFHGALSLNQLYVARPLAGLANYRTPIGGLYLCGSGAHPGGGVSGLPGHNAAREILRDRSGWLRKFGKLSPA